MILTISQGDRTASNTVNIADTKINRVYKIIFVTLVLDFVKSNNY